ncbi:MAG: hypothetical protein IIY81_04830 [Lachnospiraceae bacterium]|nr:hypothetical protein [Lachnospiraceae bacterium]
MILVTYQSKTGFTKKYAEWISAELKCDLKDIKETTAEDIKKYDLVIHGGWVLGGIINGYKKIKKYNPKKLLVFAVGLTPKKDVDADRILKNNDLKDVLFFYFEGGTNPEKMGFASRKIVEMVTKKEVTYQDNTKKSEIAALVRMAKEM